jgi:C1A family cysteine protease
VVAYTVNNPVYTVPYPVYTVPNYDETALMQAVATIGPLSIVVCANDNFMNYYTGIYSDVKCMTSNGNHAVLLVGYVQNGTNSYWIVKNSWGTWWGDKGYINMAMGKGLIIWPSYALL